MHGFQGDLVTLEARVHIQLISGVKLPLFVMVDPDAHKFHVGPADLESQLIGLFLVDP